MAVHAKRAEDSTLVQKTKVILDKLTPQVVASKFPRILERIQAKRELIQVLGEMGRVKVTPMTVGGSMVTIATEPLIKDVP